MAAPREGDDLCTRTFIPHRCHQAIGVLGAVTVATAALLPTSPATGLLDHDGSDVVRLEHPTGCFDLAINVSFDGEMPVVRRAGSSEPPGS